MSARSSPRSLSGRETHISRGISMDWRVLPTGAVAAFVIAATWRVVVLLSEVAQQQADAGVLDESDAALEQWDRW